MRRIICQLVLAIALMGMVPGAAAAADAYSPYSLAGAGGSSVSAGVQFPMSRPAEPRIQLIGNRCRRDCEWCRNDCYGRFRIHCAGDYCRPHFVKCMRHCWNTWCRWC